jgi:hypothetical protein
MNHKLGRDNSYNQDWPILIIINNDDIVKYTIFYDTATKYHLVYVKSNQLKTINYLISNNIGTIIDDIPNNFHFQIIKLNTHIELELT